MTHLSNTCSSRVWIQIVDNGGCTARAGGEPAAISGETQDMCIVGANACTLLRREQCVVSKVDVFALNKAHSLRLNKDPRSLVVTHQ